MAADLSSRVNPLVGTGLSSLHDHGNTLPGAARPFGMLHWAPDMVSETLYRWATPVTRGFSLTHLSGPGCAHFGDAPVFPMLGVSGGEAPQAGFRHEDETAEPGYYAVKLDSGIGVRIAAQVRSGIAEFRFPRGSEPHTLLFDLGRNLSPRIYATEIHVDGRKVTGSVTSGANCGSGLNRYRLYFYFEVDKAPQEAVALGPKGGYLSFAPSVPIVRMKAGLSFVSVANAEANLRVEIKGWDLETRAPKGASGLE